MGRGEILLEFSNDLSFDRQTVDGEKVRARGNESAVAISYGLLDSLDLVLAIPYEWTRTKVRGEVVDREEGLADMTLEVKWCFYEGNLGAFALKPGISLPSGDEDRGFGNGKVCYGMTFIATKEFEPLDLHFNAGYAINRFKLQADRDENRRNLWHLSLAAVRELTPKLDLVGDIGVERNGSRDSNQHPAFALVGLVYSVTEKIDLDLGAKIGLTRAEPDFSVLAGLTWSL